jgi:hypothetical protein
MVSEFIRERKERGQSLEEILDVAGAVDPDGQRFPFPAKESMVNLPRLEDNISQESADFEDPVLQNVVQPNETTDCQILNQDEQYQTFSSPRGSHLSTGYLQQTQHPPAFQPTPLATSDIGSMGWPNFQAAYSSYDLSSTNCQGSFPPISDLQGLPLEDPRPPVSAPPQPTHFPQFQAATSATHQYVYAQTSTNHTYGPYISSEIPSGTDPLNPNGAMYGNSFPNAADENIHFNTTIFAPNAPQYPLPTHNSIPYTQYLQNEFRQ